MEILAYLLALFMGLVLGLLGGGGAILTLPILVYILHIPPYLVFINIFNKVIFTLNILLFLQSHLLLVFTYLKYIYYRLFLTRFLILIFKAY
jgi:uncharacterized membrane protein YfcA